MTSMELKEKEKDKLEQPPTYEESALLNEGVKKVKTVLGFLLGSIFLVCFLGPYFGPLFGPFFGPFGFFWVHFCVHFVKGRL